jgi:hypothetical protein
MLSDLFGGRLEINEDLPWAAVFSEILQECEHSLQAPRANLQDFDISFWLTMERKFNAHCVAYKGEGLIAISGITISKLLQAARSIVTGGARLIRMDAEAAAVVPYVSATFEEIMLDRSLYENLPNFNDQFLVSSSIRIAIDILLNHELAHIIHGHAGWLKKEFGIIGISEDCTDLGTKNEILRQTLEWDADALAIQRTLMRGLNIELRPPGQNEGRYSKMPPYGRFGSRDQCLHAFGIGIYLLARFFDENKSSEKIQNLHPPVWYRIQHAFLMIVHTFDVRIFPITDDLSDKIVLPLMYGALQAEEAWCGATGREKILGNLFDEEFIQRGAVITSEYEVCWAFISPKLYEYRILPSLWDII